VPHDIRLGIRIRAPRDRVFENLLLPHHLARWWCSFAQVSPKPGGAFNFGGDYCIVPPEGHAHKCVFTGGEVRKSVTFSWPLFGGDTTAKWSVEEEGETSRFSLVHAGIAQAEGPCGTILDAYRVCLGNLKAICENRGDSLRPEYTPPAKPEVQLVILIDVAPEKVFEALAARNHLESWATRGGAANVDLSPGGRYAWGSTVASILAVEPGRKLSVAWPGTGTATFDLEPKASGTGVYFRHEGLPEGARELRNLRGWWSSLLVDLKNYLEAGEVGFLESYDEQQAES
jgi:uncharacterized protein YndB with AHSA1/START domain